MSTANSDPGDTTEEEEATTLRVLSRRPYAFLLQPELSKGTKYIASGMDATCWVCGDDPTKKIIVIVV